jgi:hypothetical protein
MAVVWWLWWMRTMKRQRGGKDDAPAIEHEQQDARGVQNPKTL